jgi:hypothetical protein
MEEWRNDKGQLHRVDGPAFIYWVKGEIVIERWYQYDKLHRLDGPAEILSNKVRFCITGTCYSTEAEYHKALAKFKARARIEDVSASNRMFAMHLTNMSSAISMIQEGIRAKTFFDVISYGRELKLSPIQGVGNEHKDLRCGLFYNVEKFANHDVITYDSFDYGSRSVNCSGKGMHMPGENVVMQSVKVLPDFLVVISRSRTRMLGQLLELCQELSIKYLVITDIERVLKCITTTWFDTYIEEYNDHWPPNIFGNDAYTSNLAMLAAIFTRFLNSMISDLVQPEIITEVNSCFDTKDLDPVTHNLVYAFIYSWYMEQPINKYAALKAAEMEEEAGMAKA